MEYRRIVRQVAPKRRRARDSVEDEEQQTPNHYGDTRQQRPQDQAKEEQQREEFHGFDDSKQQSNWPSLAAHFATLTNAVLQRITDGETTYSLYEEFMRRAKTSIVCDLKKTYNGLHFFYQNSSSPMPSWLFQSPPGRTFYTPDMDLRLESRLSQIKEELSSFLEEHGFVSPKIHGVIASESSHPFLSVHLRLDVASVSTKKARQHVGAKEESTLHSLAAHFAALTNAVLKSITDNKTADCLYEEFLQRAKTSIVCDLKETYTGLYCFYQNSSSPMPSWLFQSPPGRTFYTPDMDLRLESRLSQIKEEFSSFLEEHGFVSPKIHGVIASESSHPFLSVHLRLDVASVLTKKARQHVGAKEESTLPSVASRFVTLTNAVLQRMTDRETIDSLYEKFLQRAKMSIVCDLKETYNGLHYFYQNSSSPMPSWLFQSPPGRTFYTPDMDLRLESRLSQIKEELSSFLEEHGFVSPKVHGVIASESSHPFLSVHLRLDAARVPTKEALEHVEERLRRLKIALL